MTAPNMATIAASLERSLQNCSLRNNHQSSSGSGSSCGEGFGPSDLPENTHHHQLSNSSDTALELNSHLSLPYNWEQCLDLKTGEVYYINWKTGMRASEDPRTSNNGDLSGDYYSEDDDSSSGYDSEGSSSESSPAREQTYTSQLRPQQTGNEKNHVLVVAGCKSCQMYFMVPKHVQDCPKCGRGQVIHFDRNDSTS